MTSTDAMAMTRQPIVRPFLLACLLAFGEGVVLAILALWLAASADQWSRDEEVIAGIAVRVDGTPLLISVVGRGLGRNYYTLDGKELPTNERVEQLAGTVLSLPRADAWQPLSLSWQHRLMWMCNTGERGEELWYFLHDDTLDGRCYFVGFDRKTTHCLGYLGVNGFQEEEPREQERIPLDLRAHAISRSYRQDGRFSLISQNRLIEVDFHKRTVRTLLTADQILTHGLAVVYPSAPPSEDIAQDWPHIAYYVVRLPDRIVLKEWKMQKQRSSVIQRSFTLPTEVRDSSLTFYELRPDRALLIRTRQIVDDTRCDLDWIDASGKIVRHEKVVYPIQSIFDRRTTKPWVFTAAVSSPLLTLPLTPLLGTDTDPWPGYFAAYGSGFPNAWLPCTLAVMAAIVLAWFCYRRQRRYAQPWTAVWVVFILLGGLPAWLAFRWHRRWPVLAVCPACGQPAPRDRLHCAHCGAEFPVPQAKGIEVFAA